MRTFERGGTRWRAELIWAYGCALVTVVRLVSERAQISEREIALVSRQRELGSPLEGAQWPPEYSEGPSELRERMARLEVLHDDVCGTSGALDAESGSLVD